jgi:hypothetical protein
MSASRPASARGRPDGPLHALEHGVVDFRLTRDSTSSGRPAAKGPRQGTLTAIGGGQDRGMSPQLGGFRAGAVPHPSLAERAPRLPGLDQPHRRHRRRGEPDDALPDLRGVFRVRRVTLEDCVWRIWNDGPSGSSGRFSGSFSDDGDTLPGAPSALGPHSTATKRVACACREERPSSDRGVGSPAGG